jgi:hypothetical protein
MQKYPAKILALLIVSLSNTVYSADVSSSLDDFAKSFIEHYEFNTSGRYAHEYHPFILKKTAQSMQDLEQAFKTAGFKLPGRYILMGYEENAFPAFFPRVSDCEGALIDDEASFKDPRGWCIQLHNRFGTMTGFLFRAINKIFSSSEKALFEHINPERVEIFGAGLGMLQKYSFGELARSMFEAEDQVLKFAAKSNWRGIFSQLIDFWESLYRGEYKTGDYQVAGTQDILFSIENAKFLQKSALSLLKFFTGPDITYPIVVSKACAKQATENAQTFLSKFTQELKPIDGKKTLYVFRSFVDGVGKSTLLGNIKNWMAFGNQVESYKVVDNSSTLDFEIFAFDSKVFIADLPAQISHFTYKPEGMVWVDQKAMHFDQSIIQKPINYFEQNKAQLRQQYFELINRVKQLITVHGSSHPMFANEDNPELALVRNLIVLKELNTNNWIPFDFEGQKFLGNLTAPDQIRVFTKISAARSEGLKNVQAPQMIFSDGLCFPAIYEEFVSNLVAHAKKLGIENVVFVDFLSMYSRSSRENIRINYLMQIMGLLDSKLEPYNYMYRNFVSNSELLSMLLSTDGFAACKRGFFTESIVRFGLYTMMHEKSSPGGGCRIFKESEVISFLQQKFTALDKSAKKKIKQMIANKVEQETAHLSKIYLDTKEFVNLYGINFDEICKFSDFLMQFFIQRFRDEKINELWSNLDGQIVSENLPPEDGWIADPEFCVDLACGAKARLLCLFSPKSRDPGVLGKFLKTIRSAWYMSIANVLLAENFSADGSYMEGEEFINQIPVLVKRYKDGRICLLEKKLNKTVQYYDGKPFELREFKERRYFANYTFPSTAYAMFGFGADVGTSKFNLYYSPGFMLTDFLAQKKTGSTSNKSLKTSAVWRELGEKLNACRNYYLRGKHSKKNTAVTGQIEKINDDLLDAQYNSLKANISKAINEFDTRNANDFEGFSTGVANNAVPENKPVCLLSEDFVPAAKLFARMIATLEVIARDLDSAIVTDGSKESFFAGLKLIEHSLLPQTFNVIFDKELFLSPHTTDAEPVIELLRSG